VLDELGPEEKDRALSILEDPLFWRHLPLIPGAQEGVRALEKAGYEIIWVTAPWKSCVGWADARREWLDEHFGLEEKGHGYIPTAEKSAVDGNIFIDDKPENVRDWAMEHPHRRAFLFITPRTKNDPWPDKLDWSRVEEIM
jgi:5'(3')-deoxyribonucleotidase